MVEKTSLGEKPATKPEIKEPVKEGKSVTDKVRENPWILATIVLGVVVLIFLIGNFSGMTGGTIGVADKTSVEKKVMDFVNSQTDGSAKLVSSSLKNGLYEIIISYQSRDIPLYVTADGKNLVQGVTPLAEIMGAGNDTSGQTQTQDIPKKDKPTVELFVMSMCPYGTQAEKGLIPVLELLKSKIDFKLRFVSYAMHGKNEIDENTVQTCIQQKQPDKLISYLRCYLESSDPTKWAACRKSVGINEAQIQSCIKTVDTQFKITELFNDKSTWSGGQYPQYNVDKELNTKYGVQGSPTLVINGVESSAGRSPASYLSAICAAFNKAPAECSQTLSASTPSAGFGWTAAAASGTTATAAQCG
jgi:hypothetical protein